jgi:2-polyprenyl-6-methoxyphenol hydroxylase-like FAD-dependent oxidoreductase
MNKRFQVVIIGGGPVGMGLAIELGQRGISCINVERRTEQHRIPKGQGLTQRAMEHFYRWGIADKVRSARVLPQGFSASTGTRRHFVKSSTLTISRTARGCRNI